MSKVVGLDGKEIPTVEVREWEIKGVGKVHECVDCRALVLGDAVRCLRCTREIMGIKRCPACASSEREIVILKSFIERWRVAARKFSKFSWPMEAEDLEREIATLDRESPR